MPFRTVMSLTAAAVLALAGASSQALAFRGSVHGGVHGGGVYHGGAYHGGHYHAGHYHGGAYAYRRGAWHPGAAAVGAAIVAPSYYNSAACGYDPYPPCY